MHGVYDETTIKNPTIVKSIVFLPKGVGVEKRLMACQTWLLTKYQKADKAFFVSSLLRQAGVENRRTEPLSLRSHASGACDDWYPCCDDHVAFSLHHDMAYVTLDIGRDNVIKFSDLTSGMASELIGEF